MTYYDRFTERQRKRTVAAIRAIYTKTYTEVENLVDDYFKAFEKREKFLLEQIEKGILHFEDERAAAAYMVKWRRNQIGRGERWKAVQETIAQRVYGADVAVSKYMKGEILRAAAEAHNWRAYTIDCAATRYSLARDLSADIAFNVVNEHNVARLASGRAVFLPRMTTDEGKIVSWVNRKTTSELIAGITSGESTRKIAERFERVTQMSETSALRNARTALTNAYGAGDQMAAEEAGEMGLTLFKEWRATLDDRTRDSHQKLDGERVPIDERFSNGLMYPGDMSTNDPAEVFNCRCTYITIVQGLNDGGTVRRGRDTGGRNVVLNNMTYTGANGTSSYKKWLEGRAEAM